LVEVQLLSLFAKVCHGLKHSKSACCSVLSRCKFTYRSCNKKKLCEYIYGCVTKRVEVLGFRVRFTDFISGSSLGPSFEIQCIVLFCSFVKPSCFYHVWNGWNPCKQVKMHWSVLESELQFEMDILLGCWLQAQMWNFCFGIVLLVTFNYQHNSKANKRLITVYKIDAVNLLSSCCFSSFCCMLPLSIFDSLAAVGPKVLCCWAEHLIHSALDLMHFAPTIGCCIGYSCPLLLMRLPLSGTRDPFHALGEHKDSRQESKG